MTAELDWEVYQLDTQSAFLSADVEKEMYVKVAPGYEITHKAAVPLVMKLHKSLYGFAQSPHN